MTASVKRRARCHTRSFLKSCTLDDIATLGALRLNFPQQSAIHCFTLLTTLTLAPTNCFSLSLHNS